MAEHRDPYHRWQQLQSGARCRRCGLRWRRVKRGGARGGDMVRWTLGDRDLGLTRGSLPRSARGCRGIMATATEPKR